MRGNFWTDWHGTARRNGLRMTVRLRTLAAVLLACLLPASSAVLVRSSIADEPVTIEPVATLLPEIPLWISVSKGGDLVETRTRQRRNQITGPAGARQIDSVKTDPGRGDWSRTVSTNRGPRWLTAGERITLSDTPVATGPLPANRQDELARAAAVAWIESTGEFVTVEDIRSGRAEVRLRRWSPLRPLEGMDRLLSGLNAVGGVALHPHDPWMLISHQVPKADLPSTQTDQGWVFTNAVSIVPLDFSKPVVTLSLDLRTESFANPGAVLFSPEGDRAFVAHLGADVVSVVSIPRLLSAAGPGNQTSPASVPESTGAYNRFDPRLVRKYVVGRVPVGAGPSALGLSDDGRLLAVAHRWGPLATLVDTTRLTVVETIAGEPVLGAAARGERLFHSGRLSPGGQFSCASCHPGGDQDGLNWDLPGDGDPAFLNTKSLLSLDGTAPYGWRGTSAVLTDRIRSTLTHLFGYAVTDAEASDLEAYLHTLSVRPGSRSDSKPTESQPVPKALEADFGSKQFEALGCAKCHTGPHLTDGKTHSLEANGEAGEFETPSLRNLALTAPYWHDGRAVTLADLFQTVDPQGPHGAVTKLAAEDRSVLVQFLNSR
jgi:mono/diheme cytochrome c family protein